MAATTSAADLQSAQRWYFYRDSSGVWRWDAVADNGELVNRSALAFESRPACVADAKVNGYGMSEA